jgi:N utilization substance protein A
MAILSNGKRCPNAALPGTKYCGVQAHQDLVGQEPAEPDVSLDALPEATAEEVETVAVAHDDTAPERVEDDPQAGVPIESGVAEPQEGERI